MEYCLFTEPQQGFDDEEQIAFARAAEAAGFDGFFRSDHYLRMGGGDPLPGPTDAWTSLAAIARETSRLRLGTLVSSVTYRLPGLLAIQVAQIDRSSRGRVELGLGTGWFEEEHRAYGIPFPAKRFGMLEEQLEIIRGLWSTPVGGAYSFEGRHYRLEDSPALPKPTQEEIPLIVGGTGPTRTPSIAARFATEYNLGFQSEETISTRFATVAAACEAIERDPATLKMTVALPTLVGATDAELARRAEAAGTTVDAARNGVNVVGTPDEVVAKVERLAALGAKRVYFQIMDMRDLDQVAFFGDEILPKLPR